MFEKITEKQIAKMMWLIFHRAGDFKMFEDITSDFPREEIESIISSLSKKQAFVIISSYENDESMIIDEFGRSQRKRYNRPLARKILSQKFKQ